MLSFSNFGSTRAQRSDRIEEAVEMARILDPTLVIDGPMQADTALDSNVQEGISIHGIHRSCKRFGVTKSGLGEHRVQDA